MGQRTSPLLNFVVDQELLDRLDDFRFEHRFQSRAEAIRWLLEWALDNGATPEEKDCPPLSAFAFGGCKGAKAPCRKGVLAAANAPLSLAGAKDKKRITGKDQRTSRNTRAARRKR